MAEMMAAAGLGPHPAGGGGAALPPISPVRSGEFQQRRAEIQRIFRAVDKVRDDLASRLLLQRDPLRRPSQPRRGHVSF